mgnify:CR=1 FL=1
MTTTQDIRTLALQAHAVQQEAEAQQKRIEGERAAEEKRQQDATLAAKVRAFASVRLGLELPDTQEYPVPLPGIGYLTYATDQFRSPYLNLEPRCAEPGCAQTYRNQVLTLAALGRRAEQFPPGWRCYLHDGQHTEDGDPIEPEPLHIPEPSPAREYAQSYNDQHLDQLDHLFELAQDLVKQINFARKDYEAGAPVGE